MKLHIRSLAAALSVAAFLLTPHASFAAEKSKTKTLDSTNQKALAAHIGKKVTVEGTVLSVGKGSKDGIRFLNFSEKKDSGFVASIFPSAYKQVGPIKNYEGKSVRVTGVLEKYNKQTQIKVTEGSQIKSAPAPKSEKKKK